MYSFIFFCPIAPVSFLIQKHSNYYFCWLVEHFVVTLCNDVGIGEIELMVSFHHKHPKLLTSFSTTNVAFVLKNLVSLYARDWIDEWLHCQKGHSNWRSETSMTFLYKLCQKRTWSWGRGTSEQFQVWITHAGTGSITFRHKTVGDLRWAWRLNMSVYCNLPVQRWNNYQQQQNDADHLRWASCYRILNCCVEC